MERNMDESRKAFEQYSADMLGLPLEMISDARDGDRYRHSFDRASIMQPLNGWWVLWQASRAAIEIELPDVEKWRSVDAVRAQAAYKSHITTELSASGIKVKE